MATKSINKANKKKLIQKYYEYIGWEISQGDTVSPATLNNMLTWNRNRFSAVSIEMQLGQSAVPSNLDSNSLWGITNWSPKDSLAPPVDHPIEALQTPSCPV